MSIGNSITVSVPTFFLPTNPRIALFFQLANFWKPQKARTSVKISLINSSSLIPIRPPTHLVSTEEF
jgi:hypothetical protein